jgi:hypothetical protein
VNSREIHEKLAAGYRAAKYKFILPELDLAMTFCDIALGTDDKEKAKRNFEKCPARL